MNLRLNLTLLVLHQFYDIENVHRSFLLSEIMLIAFFSTFNDNILKISTIYF